MYYITVDPDDESRLAYCCHNCGHRDASADDDCRIVDVVLHKNAASFTPFVNEYTKFDPTLPRIDSIPCPNDACPTHAPKAPAKRETVYIRYDEANLKYLYLCCVCDRAWTL
jgi:hypothetical protein